MKGNIHQPCRPSRPRDASLVADGLDGVEARRLLGGIPAEEHTRACADGKAHNHGPELNLDGPMGKRLDRVAGAYAKAHANESARDAQHDGLV